MTMKEIHGILLRQRDEVANIQEIAERVFPRLSYLSEGECSPVWLNFHTESGDRDYTYIRIMQGATLRKFVEAFDYEGIK